MLINAIGTYSASQPLESMAITRRDPGRRMYRSPSLTAASATPISTRRDRNGQERCIPACRGMKLWVG